MKLSNIKGIVIFAVLGSMTMVSVASEAGHGAAAGSACTAFGPQTPRDIDNHKGANKQSFS